MVVAREWKYSTFSKQFGRKQESCELSAYYRRVMQTKIQPSFFLFGFALSMLHTFPWAVFQTQCSGSKSEASKLGNLESHSNSLHPRDNSY